MLNIVFTGPAIDGNGNSVLRADLAAACQKKGGMAVQPAVRADTNVVVASRTDTVKAKRAEERGLAVLTYPQFIAHFLRGVSIESGGKANSFVDAVNKDLLVPDFTDGAQLAAMDVL
jgi:hypothetical protein